jgi:hypothetical protein
MGADLGSRAPVQSLMRGHHPLSLRSPPSLSCHMQDAAAASRLAEAHPCPERASHIGQWGESRVSDPAARKPHVHGRQNNRMLFSKSILILSLS